MKQLYNRLISDLKSLGKPLDCTVELKPYSKTYFGRYNPNTKKIILYVFEDSNLTRLYSYDVLLDTLIHEYTHHRQHQNPNFKRHKGVMHDCEFVAMYNRYKDIVYSKKLWRELRKVC